MAIVGLALVILSAACSLVAARTAYKTYKNLRTPTFYYMYSALSCFVILPLGYLFPIFISDPLASRLVTMGTLLFNISAYIGLACIVAAVENLKRRPNELVIDFTFLFAGILVAVRFLPTFQEMIWNGVSWQMTFKLPLMIAFALYYDVPTTIFQCQNMVLIICQKPPDLFRW